MRLVYRNITISRIHVENFLCYNYIFYGRLLYYIMLHYHKILQRRLRLVLAE